MRRGFDHRRRRNPRGIRSVQGGSPDPAKNAEMSLARQRLFWPSARPPGRAHISKLISFPLSFWPAPDIDREKPRRRPRRRVTTKLRSGIRINRRALIQISSPRDEIRGCHGRNREEQRNALPDVMNPLIRFGKANFSCGRHSGCDGESVNNV